ncbi:hypothetical protein BH23GEM11_BH23GEM11_16010 [soil metagenome]
MSRRGRVDGHPTRHGIGARRRQQVRVLSVLTMFGFLAVLLRINVLVSEARVRPGEGPTWVSNLSLAAFGVYLGWVLVAALVNVTTLLVATEWDGGGVSDATWAIVLVLVGAAMGVFTMERLRNVFVGAAVVWAFGGIALNRWDDVPSIAWTAGAMVGVVAGSAAFVMVDRFRRDRGPAGQLKKGQEPARQ